MAQAAVRSTKQKAPRGAGPEAASMPAKQVLDLCTGGEGGIRTHGDVATTPDFESGTFDHSATSPAFNIAAGHCRKFYQRADNTNSSAQFCDATHIRPQHLWHRHRAIGILIILKHRH